MDEMYRVLTREMADLLLARLKAAADAGLIPSADIATIALRAAVDAAHSVQRRLRFPLVRTGSSGTIRLTNEQIGEILDAEDAESIGRTGEEKDCEITSDDFLF